MSDCKKYIESISSMMDGELTAEQESELRTHMEHCAECRKVYNAFKSISDSLSEDLIQPPETLSESIMSKIKLQNKSGYKKRFAFGRFTAVAACFALILFGASRSGLLSDSSKKANETAAAPKEIEVRSVTGTCVPESGVSIQDDYGAVEKDAPAESKPASEHKDKSDEAVSEEGTVIQFGFATQNLAILNGTKAQDIKKEPVFLFEAKEFSVYQGKYYAEENSTDKNTLLFNVSGEEDISAFSQLLAAIPENSIENKADDKKIIEESPKYTLLIPADKEKDEKAKDKIISIWYIKEEIWCVAQDACPPDKNSVAAAGVNNAEKILYRGEGIPDKFEELIKKVKEKNGIM